MHKKWDFVNLKLIFEIIKSGDGEKNSFMNFGRSLWIVILSCDFQFKSIPRGNLLGYIEYFNDLRKDKSSQYNSHLAWMPIAHYHVLSFWHEWYVSQEHNTGCNIST